LISDSYPAASVGRRPKMIRPLISDSYPAASVGRRPKMIRPERPNAFKNF